MIDFSTKKVIELITKNERKNRRRNVLILTLATMLALLFFFTSVFHIHKDHEKIDSISQVNTTLQTIISREDSIRQVVGAFLQGKEKAQFSIVRGLMADTLQRYFLHSKISSDEAVKLDSVYWTHNPRQKFKHEPSFALSSPDSNFTSAIVFGGFAKDSTSKKYSETIELIKIDRNYHIVFVRAYNP